jgi:hypothetical protein
MSCQVANRNRFRCRWATTPPESTRVHVARAPSGAPASGLVHSPTPVQGGRTCAGAPDGVGSPDGVGEG